MARVLPLLPMRVTVDLAHAGLKLEPQAIETYTSTLADEMRHHRVAEDAWVARPEDLPEERDRTVGEFIKNKVLAILRPAQLLAFLNFLGERFYGATLELNYEDDDKKVNLKYRNAEQLEQQLQAIERLAALQVNVIQ